MKYSTTRAILLNLWQFNNDFLWITLGGLFHVQRARGGTLTMTLRIPLYLDYMATTPVDPRVKEKMLGCLDSAGVFGNAASQSHRYGWEAGEAVERARHNVAALVRADPREIIWTSGATEANNLAIKGAAYFYQRKGKHLIICKTEHRSVVDPCRYLERQGFAVTALSPEPNGLLDSEKLKAAMRDDTI